MTSTSTNPWSAEVVRLTMFPLPQLHGIDTVTRMWRAVAGTGDPDETTSKTATATHLVQGPFLKGRLLVTTQPGRIDVHYTVEPQPVVTSANVLGPAEEVLVDFLGRAVHLIQDVPPLHRLAFGGVFLMEAESREAGYRALAPFLRSLKLEPENTSDFSYQINRPRASRTEVEGLRINRLAKWSVQGLTVLRFNPEASGGAAARQPSAVNAVYSPRFEADINTVADGRELSSKALPALLSELVDLTRELATQGDIP